MGLNVINSPLRYEEALSMRDSFAKNIYEKTFNYLIKKMNEKIEIEHVNLEDEKGSNNYRKSIGLLDIFGFEVLGINSLEQFFINFANEKLQQLYVSYIFKEEQNEFMREGLREFSHDIGFQDNKPVIDLFENYPLGIFHLINQSSELNQDDKDLPSSI
jgi:myosin heavy subunit